MTTKLSRRAFFGAGTALGVIAACSRPAIAPDLEGAAKQPAIAPQGGIGAPAVGVVPLATAPAETRPTAAPTAVVAAATTVRPTQAPAMTGPAAPTSAPAISPTSAPATPTAAPTATSPPTATASPVPTRTPTPVATATPAPTDTPVPTATPLTFNAARLTNVLGRAQTSYAGSIPARAHNVELATKRINGTQVPPGAVCSFNAAVGEATLAAGFKIGYGISLVNGRPGTVPSVAGGICQVSSTLFQTAFWAGLPIVEHHYHRYWIPRYGQPPSGMTGTDATVDAPYLDFKFRNTTDDWLLIESSTDGENVYFTIRGVNPGWKVEATRPAVKDVVQADQTMVFEDDETLPYGEKLYVEHAEDGFTVSLARTVTALGGKVVDRWGFTNKYEPARNVTLVGMKGAPPRTPTPTVSASPMASQTPNGTPGVAPDASAPVVTPTTVLTDGRVRVPTLVGQLEADARATIERAGLVNTYTNYQGPGEIPDAALKTVSVGHVLSQDPPGGTVVGAGSVVKIAVRKA